MRTATLVKSQDRTDRNSAAIRFGDAALYRLSEPYACGYDDEEKTCEFMFVSTSCVMGEWETYAFPADETGDCTSWRELPGSEKGTTEHAPILANMGYTLVREADRAS